MKQHLSHTPGPIGVFDSGYGGLTILNKIREALPEYDYVYLGDNARTPYGTRSFEIVYEFTLQAVNKLFEMGCHLVILACNTASAKALRSIQMNDLPGIDPERRVLGVIRPTVECIGDITQSRHIGVLATAGTIKSESYPLEIHKLFPDIQVSGMACPMWVPLVENNESQNEGADYFIRKYIDQLLSKDPEIDTMLYLTDACTELELFQDGNHQKMGLTCTDCHMPQTEAADGATYTHHNMTQSPLENPAALDKCLTCHKSQGVEDADAMVTFVKGKMDELAQIQQATKTKLDEFHAKLAEVVAAGNADETKLQAAKDAYNLANVYFLYQGTAMRPTDGSMAAMNFSKSVEQLQKADDAIAEGMAQIA